MRICVLGGAGHIGSGIVRELVKRAPDVEVVIADKNLDEAKRLAAGLGGKTSAEPVDADDHENLFRVMKDVDVVISAVGPYYVYGVKVLKAAIDAETNFVDIDDDYDSTKSCLDLDEEVKKAGVTAIIGLGATPGLTNILAKYGAEKLERVDEIHTFWAWTALDPTMGPAIIDHYLHASTGNVPTYRDGKWVEIAALSEPEVVEFPPPIGEIEVYHVGHPEPVTIPRYMEGVKVVTNKGTVWPSYMADLTKVSADLDLIARASAETEEKYGEYALTGVCFGVRVKGEREGKTTCYSYGVACRSAVVCTALPAALGALMVARGEVEDRGVFAPEGVIDSNKFLKEISKDIEILEIEEKAGEL